MPNRSKLQLTTEGDVVTIHYPVEINSELSIPVKITADLSKYPPGEHETYLRHIIFDLFINDEIENRYINSGYKP